MFVILFFLINNLPAQIELGGLVDFEVAKGGKDSAFDVNNLTNEYKEPHLAINQFNLFLYSQINANWYINTRLQFDTWGTGQLNSMRLSLAELNWEPEDSPFRISIGRFVNPFGLYPQRQLSVSNLFLNTPLAYGSGLNITSSHGYTFNYDSTYSTNQNYGYGYSSGRLSTISYAGYTTGIQFSWLLFPEVMNLDLVLSNAAPASQSHYTNLANWAGMARLSFQPAIYWQQGVSLSRGSFMESSEVNSDFSNLESFSQTLLGTDWILAYSLFELSGEFIYSMWKVPGFDTDGFVVDKWDNLKKFDLENYSYYFDLKYEPSFLSGSFLALRFEELKFVKYEEEQGYYSTTPGVSFNWGSDVRRYSIAFGYKISTDVLFKIAYSDQEYSASGWSPEAYTLRAMLSAGF